MANANMKEIEGLEDYLRRTAVGPLSDALVLEEARTFPEYDESNRVLEGWYWHGAYRREMQFDRDYLYEDYAPAFRVGYLYHLRHPDAGWNQVELELKPEWDELKGVSRLPWSKAQRAIRSAWQHARDATDVASTTQMA